MHKVERIDASVTIRVLQDYELPMTLGLLSTFYPDLNKDLLLERLKTVAKLNWQCVGVFEEAELVGLTGYWLNTRIYCGKYLYIDHFIIKLGNRSRGVGAQLLNHVRALADHYQCEQICLDTFVTNSMAQSFWTRHGFSIVGFHYVAK
ncbi:GNAT family N-acetyltransferase [Pseudomonas sp. A34-9]|uniref:GNAT family N-acetyltransferase n=1 Tax=Pseudomonas sp. A34-9 TaxID=3034675 RepID=UPI00240DF041|nr:GNAT family N-acetyltransferase [Pseudomonas sp. A34-9]